jgi:FtsH-binding integral membrane protein
MEKLKNWIINNWFKFLAAVLLLWALADNPYGYYQLLRWFMLAIGGYLAYRFYKNKKIIWAIIFGLVALLFNPIIPFYLQKNVWQIIDIIVAILFFASIFVKTDKKQR